MNIPSGFHFQNQKSGIFKDFIRVYVFAGKSVQIFMFLRQWSRYTTVY